MNKILIYLFSLGILTMACHHNSIDLSDNIESESLSITNLRTRSSPLSTVLSVEDFLAKMEVLDKVQLVDVRTAAEVENGSIDGAINIDFYADDFRELLLQLDRDIPLFVYCKSGGRSAKVANLCDKLGFKEVYDLEGGYSAYKDAH